MRTFEKVLFPAGGIAILLLVFVAIVLFVFPLQTAQAPVVPIDEETGDPAQEELANIIVAEPVAGDVVGLPLVITGQARVFENVFQYRVRDDAGVVLAEGHAMADAPDIGTFGPFTLSLNYDEPTTSTGLVEVFSYSARDGSEENMVSIPVSFSSEVEVREVGVYFLPQDAVEDCTSVIRVDRRVPSTLAIAHAAMTELLVGVRPSEGQDFITLIPYSARLRSLVLEEGVATVTFAKDSFLGVAGSCMVLGIRSQIEATLTQFSSISSVIIVEEGKTAEETLQP